MCSRVAQVRAPLYRSIGKPLESERRVERSRAPAPRIDGFLLVPAFELMHGDGGEEPVRDHRV